MVRKERVLLTGGAGFIGREVHRTLVNKGFVVDICDLEPAITANFHLMDKRFDLLYTDTFAHIDAATVCQYDYVVHCAAISDTRWPQDCSGTLWHTNYAMASRLAEMCANSSKVKFIFISSASVYGDRPCIETNSPDQLCPQTAYSMTKLATENAIRAIFSEKPFSYLILRPFNVYGEGEETKLERTRSLVYRLCDSAVWGPNMQVHSPKASRDFVHVTDVAAAITSLVIDWPDSVQFPIRVMNVGSANPISVETLVSKITLLADLAVRFVPNPYDGLYQNSSCALFRTDRLSFLKKDDVQFDRSLKLLVDHVKRMKR